MARPPPAYSGVDPVSRIGPFVRIFTEGDIATLSSVAGRHLQGSTDLSKAAGKLNLALYGAHLMAEQARFEMSPGELRTKCKAISLKGSEFLQTLGLPTELLAYTRDKVRQQINPEKDWSDLSPIAARLRRQTSAIEPLPTAVRPTNLKSLDEDQRTLAIDRAVDEALSRPLTPGMIPAGISDQALSSRIYKRFIAARVSSILELQEEGFIPEYMHRSLPQVEANVAAEYLLEIAPAAIALIITLAEAVEKEAEGTVTLKQNYARTFRWALFYWLASYYFEFFGVPPNTSDNVRGPEGPATQWVARVLMLAAERVDQITVVRSAYGMQASEAARDRLVVEIHRTARLKLSVLAKRLGEGWRACRESADLNRRRPKSP